MAQRTTRPPVTIADLERWTDHGAVWRTLECGTDLAVVELCTCYGEPVDVVESREPGVIDYVRSVGSSGAA